MLFFVLRDDIYIYISSWVLYIIYDSFPLLYMFHGYSSSSPFFLWLLVKLMFWVGTWKLEIIDRVGKYSGQQMNRLGGLGFSH